MQQAIIFANGLDLPPLRQGKRAVGFGVQLPELHRDNFGRGCAGDYTERHKR